MKRNTESGAIVIEATISLTAFFFAIVTILLIVNIYFVQAKMGVALNGAAKEVSQYSYLYFKAGINEVESALSDQTEQSRKDVSETIDGVDKIQNSVSNIQTGIETGSYDGMFDEAKNIGSTAKNIGKMYTDRLSDDPKGFMIGMSKMALQELGEKAKSRLLSAITRSAIQKNLKAYPEDSADSFLKRHKVVGGLDGLDFNYCTFLAYGTSDAIQLVVTYEVEVVKLLNIDYKFKFRQCAKTKAWGNGISLISKPGKENEASIWDNKNVMQRGKLIVANEKENYTYTDSGNGFDAYNNSDGANEFITIVSINTHEKTYQKPGEIKNRMRDAYNKMYNGSQKLDETITVNRGSQQVQVDSPKESRTYKVVLVVPDNTDMNSVKKQVEDFQKSNPGVTVEVKTGYGSPSQKDADTKENAKDTK